MGERRDVLEVSYREIDATNFSEVRDFLLTHEYSFRDSGPPGYVVKSPEVVEAKARKFMAILAEGKKRYHCLGAFRGEGLLGAIYLEIYDVVGRDACHVHGLWIRPEERRQGIARELKERAEVWGRSQGCAFMDTNVVVTNAGMIALNEDLGYTVARYNFRKELAE